MDTFAFIIHPIDPKRDVSRKFPLLGKIFTENQINFLSTFFPPVYLSEITGIQSQATGKQVKGWLIACPFTPKQMMSLPNRMVYRKIIQTGKNVLEIEAEAVRDSQRHTEKYRDRQRQTETKTDRDRQRQTETDRQRQRQTDTNRQRQTS